MMQWRFSTGFWRVFGSQLLNSLFFKSERRYNYGSGYDDVKKVCRYYKEQATREILESIIVENSLKQDSDLLTMKKIMKYFIDNYHPRYYYTSDGNKDTWNHPVDTLKSFHEAKNHDRRSFTTDCDDYAILIYNLARAAGVPSSALRLCYMKTRTEWHLNVMFIHDNVPYAVEGTYYPEVAYANLGRKPYFHNETTGGTHLYDGVRWLWNEDELRVNKGKINKV